MADIDTSFYPKANPAAMFETAGNVLGIANSAQQNRLLQTQNKQNQLDLVQDQVGQLVNVFSGLATSPDLSVGLIQNQGRLLVQQGLISQQQLDTELSQIPPGATQDQLRETMNRYALRALDAGQRFTAQYGTPSILDTGSTQTPISMSPLRGTRPIGPTISNTLTPSQLAEQSVIGYDQDTNQIIYGTKGQQLDVFGVNSLTAQPGLTAGFPRGGGGGGGAPTVASAPSVGAPSPMAASPAAAAPIAGPPPVAGPVAPVPLQSPIRNAVGVGAPPGIGAPPIPMPMLQRGAPPVAATPAVPPAVADPASAPINPWVDPGPAGSADPNAILATLAARRAGAAGAATPPPVAATPAITPPPAAIPVAAVPPAAVSTPVSAGRALSPPPGAVGAQEAKALASANQYTAAQAQEANFGQKVAPLESGLRVLTSMGDRGFGPGSQGIHDIQSFLRTVSPEVAALAGVDINAINDFDVAKQYLNSYARGVSSGAADQLATAFSDGNVTSLQNGGAAELIKTALALRRMQNAIVRSFDAAHGRPEDYSTYAADQGNKEDARAYGFDLMTPNQQVSLLQSLTGAAKDKFMASLTKARDLGLVTLNIPGL